MGNGYVDTIIHGQIHSEPEIIEEEDFGKLLKFDLLAKIEGSYRIVNVQLRSIFVEEEKRNLFADNCTRDIFLAGSLECYMDTSEKGLVFTHYEMDARYIAYNIYE